MTPADLAPLTSLEKILVWMKEQSLDLGVIDLIAQDEFSHDLLVPVAGRYAVFGLT